MVDNCFVIIRSVGERTENVCYNIVRSQLNDDSQIVIVRDLPFGEAHKQSIEFALQANNSYSLFLDADVLLGNNAINTMLKEAENFHSSFYMCNFAILDFQFRSPTYAGVHLYTKKTLSQSLKYIDESLDNQRPETYICQKVAKELNIPTIGIDCLVGLHGFEQWYEDIYRTLFVRAVKFSHRFNFIFERIYSDYQEDTDNIEKYLMLRAFLDGTKYRLTHEVAPLLKAYYLPYFEKFCKAYGLNERPSLDRLGLDVDHMIAGFIPDELFRMNQDWLLPKNIVTPIKISLWKKQRKKILRFFHHLKLLVQEDLITDKG